MITLSTIVDGGEFIHAEVIHGCLVAIAKDRSGAFHAVMPISFGGMNAWIPSLTELSATTLETAIAEMKSAVRYELKFRMEGGDEIQDEIDSGELSDPESAQVELPAEMARLQVALAGLKG